MRKEATIGQWKELYASATRLKEMKPWETFWDLDIIAVQNGEEEDTVFYSILGHGGECYGISVYEGYEAFNTFMMLTMQDQLNLPTGYAMFSQKNLTCYWGSREELKEKQRNVIKELGYKYRGKNQWLYFLSFEPGYRPYNLDQDEVLRMTEHFQDLELALKCYEDMKEPVDFEGGEMFLLAFEKGKKKWKAGAAPLPFTGFQFGNLIITDDELLAELEDSKRYDVTLEMDVVIPGFSVNDKKYKKPANPAVCMIADAQSGMMLRCEIQDPEEDAVAALAEELVGFILNVGIPKEIRVSNILVEAGLEQICDVCGIKLRRVKRLQAMEEFLDGMERMM